MVSPSVVSSQPNTLAAPVPADRVPGGLFPGDDTPIVDTNARSVVEPTVGVLSNFSRPTLASAAACALGAVYITQAQTLDW